MAGTLGVHSREPDLVLDGAGKCRPAPLLWPRISATLADRPVWIVYGAMQDDNEEVTGELFPLAECVIATAPHFARALRPGNPQRR